MACTRPWGLDPYNSKFYSRTRRKSRFACSVWVDLIGRKEYAYTARVPVHKQAGNVPQPLPVPRHLGGVPQPHSKLPATGTRFFASAPDWCGFFAQPYLLS